MTGGLQVSFKFVTLGVEMRGATAKLSTVNPKSITIGGVDFEDIEDVDDIDINTDDLFGPKVNTKLPGVRFILGFRF